MLYIYCNIICMFMFVHRYIESSLEEALKEDKGTGCEIPNLDPFAKEVTQFDKEYPKVVCNGQSWVKCYHSECRVVPEVLKSTVNVTCFVQDIMYESDLRYQIVRRTLLVGDSVYILQNSDHIKVSCHGYSGKTMVPIKWQGLAAGFRRNVKREPVPPGREDALNVLIFGFDSTAKNGFIRKMPNSYKYITEVMKSTVLNGYNIVGDGTPAALFPILTGKTELELPDVRKSAKNNGSLDVMPFMFYKVRDIGYRTAYFEDMPWIGTFQYRFNGFRHQPADHYLRSFYLEESKMHYWWKKAKYCVGDTPRYKLMMNLTDQFLEMDGKKYIFTFVADITHDDINMLGTADDDFVEFLKTLVQKKVLDNTLLIIMGDHGPRYSVVRDTFQGKLEERLPLMAIRLPEQLKRARPDVQSALEANVNALTTPHDIYATVLDVLDMTEHWSQYKVAGADLTRGMTLLEPVPRNRSCSEAGIEPHWCACVSLHNVSQSDAIYRQAANAFVDYINGLTEEYRSLCVRRSLLEIKWVMRQKPNKQMLLFVGAKDVDGYVGKFNKKYDYENYQIKVVVSPGQGVYEASLRYNTNEQKFLLNTRDISRTNAYGEEPSCISEKHPHLNPYCYCKDYRERA